jgi:hypothetical protein
MHFAFRPGMASSHRRLFTITLATAFRSDFADVLAEEIRVVPTLCELTVEVPCEKPAELAKEDPPELEP